MPLLFGTCNWHVDHVDHPILGLLCLCDGGQLLLMLLESLKPKRQEELWLGFHVGFSDYRLVILIMICLSGRPLWSLRRYVFELFLLIVKFRQDQIRSLHHWLSVRDEGSRGRDGWGAVFDLGLAWFTLILQGFLIERSFAFERHLKLGEAPPTNTTRVACSLIVQALQSSILRCFSCDLMLILASNSLVLALHCYQMAWRYVGGGPHIPLVKVTHIYTGLLL